MGLEGLLLLHVRIRQAARESVHRNPHSVRRYGVHEKQRAAECQHAMDVREIGVKGVVVGWEGEGPKLTNKRVESESGGREEGKLLLDEVEEGTEGDG